MFSWMDLDDCWWILEGYCWSGQGNGWLLLNIVWLCTTAVDCWRTTEDCRLLLKGCVCGAMALDGDDVLQVDCRLPNCCGTEMQDVHIPRMRLAWPARLDRLTYGNARQDSDRHPQTNLTFTDLQKMQPRGGRLQLVLMRHPPQLSVKTCGGGVQPGVGGGGVPAGGSGGGLAGGPGGVQPGVREGGLGLGLRLGLGPGLGLGLLLGSAALL